MKSKKEQTIITVGLIGNPNTGKTSLLNCLTGLDLHVGNWPGKTVEKKEGFIQFEANKIRIVDLPGTYSIAPYSEEEKIARNFIISKEADVIVQVIDINVLERNLLMTFEVLALGRNLILAFNFNKEAKKRGVKIDIPAVRKILDIPIVQIEANTCENKEELLKEIIKASKKKPKIPSHIKSLIKSKDEIEHHDSLGFIKKNIQPVYSVEKTERVSDKIDSVILNKYTALPILFAVISIMFAITFAISTPLVDIIGNFFDWTGLLIGNLDLPIFINSFLVDGIIGGIGSIISYTPIIFILYIFIAIFEDTGYLPRTVVLIDKLFHKFGISGRTFIPMILGFGCSVPACLATRTIRDKKERLIAMFITAFIPCSAYLPFDIFITRIFFPQYYLLALISLYLFSVVIAFLASLILSKLIKVPNNSTLLIELPPYRMPTPKCVFRRAWHQTILFFKKTGSIIFFAILIIWLLASLPYGVIYGSSYSILGKIGKLLTPVFKPLGFGFWEFTVPLIFGFVAKEIFIGLLGTLYGVGKTGLTLALSNSLSPLQAFSFLIFAHLYIPCIATCAVMKKETKSWKFLFARILTSLIAAWILTFIIYNIGMMLGFK